MMASLSRLWKNLSLGSKLTGLVSLLVLVVVCLLTVLSIRRENISFYEGLENQARLLLGTLPLTMRDQLYNMQLDELMDIASVVSANDNITMFIVYDHRGVILVDATSPELEFSQDIDLVGEVLIDYGADQISMEWQDEQLFAGRAIVLGNEPIGAVAIGLSTRSLDQKIASLTRQSILIALVTLALGGGLAFILSRQIANPLYELTGVASRMAGGELSILVDIHSRDEIGRLGEAFNTMARAIQKRETELRVLAGGLERLVVERTDELQQQYLKLEQIAITDPLTEIHNRRFFFELAGTELKRALRYRHPLAVLLIDVDNFKKVNDVYGHLVGDQVLVNLASLCKENIRDVDIFARYGGEEFIILMPEAGCTAAVRMAERLREIVAEKPIVTGEDNISITISLGIACWNGEQDLSINALISDADQALYQSKAAGRNKATLWVNS